MSNRWFILFFSILFLFAFRIWINDISITHQNEGPGFTVQVDLEEDNQSLVLIFPTSVAPGGSIYSDYNLVDLTKDPFPVFPDSPEEYRYLYIFPRWPDSLPFDLQEGVVESHLYPNSGFKDF